MSHESRLASRKPSVSLFIKQEEDEDCFEILMGRPEAKRQRLEDRESTTTRQTSANETMPTGGVGDIPSASPTPQAPAEQWDEMNQKWLRLLEIRPTILNHRNQDRFTLNDTLTLDKLFIIANHVDWNDLSEPGQIHLMQAFDMERHNYEENQPDIYGTWYAFWQEFREAWLAPSELDLLIKSHAVLARCLQDAFEQPILGAGEELYYCVDLMVQGFQQNVRSYSPDLTITWISPPIHIWKNKLEHFANFARRLGWDNLGRALKVLDLSEKYLTLLDKKWVDTCRLSKTMEDFLENFIDISEQPVSGLENNQFKNIMMHNHSTDLLQSITTSPKDTDSRLHQITSRIEKLKASNKQKSKQISTLEAKVKALEKKTAEFEDKFNNFKISEKQLIAQEDKLKDKREELLMLRKVINSNKVDIGCLQAAISEVAHQTNESNRDGLSASIE